MVKLKQKDTKDEARVKDTRIVVQDSEPVREVWINSGGSFSSAPLNQQYGLQPFRLPQADRQRLLDEAYRLWKFDPLGGSIVRTTTFFTLGRGINFQFDDENAQLYAAKFYKKNMLEVRMRSASDEANAFGEVFIWLRPKVAEERKGSKVIWRRGDVQVTFIPPDNVTNIETAEEDICDIYNLIYEYQDGDLNPISETIPHISKFDINGNEDAVARGCYIHLKFNAGNMDAFGHSDLIPIKEWLDNYQEYLRDGVIINKLYRSPCYDISIEDATEEEVNAAVSRYRGWSIGSNPVHNAREKWQILEFTGPNSSNEEARRALLLIIAAGVGFAEFMLADGSNSNLATSKSQKLPVIKKFEDRQDLWAYHVKEMFQFALMAKAVLNPRSGLSIETDKEGDMIPFKGEISFPDIQQDRDLEVAQTNKLALEGKYMSIRTAAARLGLDLDRELEMSRNDVKTLEELQNMMIDAGLINDPTKPPPGKEQPGTPGGPPLPPSRAGQAEGRPRRDRSREGNGSNSSVST